MSATHRPIVAAEAGVLKALHAHGLLAATAALPEGLHVAGAMLADAARRSPRLPGLCLEAGCRTFQLDGDDMEAACEIASAERLDVTPCAALALIWARRRSAVLLTMDAPLASSAKRKGLSARGLPWISGRVLSAKEGARASRRSRAS